MLSKEIERVGIPTVCVTAFHTVAERVATNRILIAGGKFHYPFGNPDLPKQKEFQWRRIMVKAALNLLTKPVEKVTVFTQEEPSR